MRWKLIVLLKWKWKTQLDNIREYVIAENEQQEFTFVCDQNEAQQDLFLRFYLQSYATLTVQLIIAHVSANVKIECILGGEGAQARIQGAYLLSGHNAVTINTFQHHKVANTSSTVVMKGALCDTASVNYHGTIRVEKESSEVYASQENKNILLSNNARAVSVPNLEVLNNDVKCFHGSAIGRFDQEHLFYAACRGIDEKRAEEILLQAFFADVVDDELNEKVKYGF
jgi:Fe-S cluster assembly protein SufD